MQTNFFRRLTLAGACALALATTAGAQEFKSGSIVVEKPWVRATPAGAKVAGGYLTVMNKGADADRLIGGTFARASRVEIHEMKMEGSMMQMRPLPNGLELKPGQTVRFEPGSYHLMLMDLASPVKEGETIKGQLRFEKAGTVDVEFPIVSMGAQGPGMSGMKAMPGH